MEGILNVHKPSGITSHDVVQRVRRMLGERRVGHTGTLDPAATGVLVLCIGKATRIAQYLEAGEKEYQAVMRLGVTTDTFDADGRVVETRGYAPPDRSSLLQALKGFVGSALQTPPAYSAVKVGGVPSYKLARQGKALPLTPRQVTIRGIELVAYNDPLLTVTVTCSKGVYIRTLCSDLGKQLGMGAHLLKLVRTRSGGFLISDALTLDQLDGLCREGGAEAVIIPMERALSDVPALTVSDDDADRITHGNGISRPVAFSGEGVLVRVHDQPGRFLALARVRGGEIRPETVFA
ncbi:MAG TPA: tRNA pseudouridine(55) synthase TruB [Nitrospirota bacterium]|nr:tRNA pseudouridine(55) synthase TruB [Nitrospirota bacterium]